MGLCGCVGSVSFSASIPCACSRGRVATATAQSEWSRSTYRWRTCSCSAAAQRIHRLHWLRQSVCPSLAKRSAVNCNGMIDGLIEVTAWWTPWFPLTWHCTQANRATSTATMRTSLLGFIVCSTTNLASPAVAFIPKQFLSRHSQHQFN